jgi:hypothetical protein
VSWKEEDKVDSGSDGEAKVKAPVDTVASPSISVAVTVEIGSRSSDSSSGAEEEEDGAQRTNASPTAEQTQASKAKEGEKGKITNFRSFSFENSFEIPTFNIDAPFSEEIRYFCLCFTPRWGGQKESCLD